MGLPYDWGGYMTLIGHDHYDEVRTAYNGGVPCSGDSGGPMFLLSGTTFEGSTIGYAGFAIWDTGDIWLDSTVLIDN